MVGSGTWGVACLMRLLLSMAIAAICFGRASAEEPATPGGGYWRQQAAQHIADKSVSFVAGVDRAFADLQHEFSSSAGSALVAAGTRARAANAGVSTVRDSAGHTLATRYDDGKSAKFTEGPMSIDQVMQLLDYDETLAFVVPDKEGGFLYVLRNDGAWFFSLPPEPDPGKLSKTLRCMAAARVDPSCRSAGEQVAEAQPDQVSRGAISLQATGAGLTPFDLGASYNAFTHLFPQNALALMRSRGGLENATDLNKLIVVSSNEMLGLPWHLLVTQPPQPWMLDPVAQMPANKQAAWLFRSFTSVSVLPDLASLVALRGERWVHSGLDRPFLGVADPMIGRTENERNAPPATCDPQAITMAAGELERRVAVAPNEIVSHNALVAGKTYADVDAVRRLPRLPDTRCEVERAAGDFVMSTSRTLLFGTDATETRLKQMDTSGELVLYRTIHLATHGLSGGQLGVGEPGLILTPPATASAEDDGVLTAPEIASMRIGADLVILSACDTAAGSKPGSEPLSGLASAFFAAGAHTVIVSSWAVYSQAASDLIARMFKDMLMDPMDAPGEGLSKAMLQMLDAADSDFTAHPAYWAPFVVVGDPRVVDDMYFKDAPPEGQQTQADRVNAARTKAADIHEFEAR